MRSPTGLYGEAALPTDPTCCKTMWPSRVLVQRVGRVAKNALGCYSVALATR